MKKTPGQAENQAERRVLVVEDDEGLRRLIVKRLNASGFSAAEASCGREALNSLQQEPGRILVLDQMLPDMTGNELINRLRRDGGEIPFIIMTGQGDERLAVELMKMGARDYLVKGLDLLELLPGALHRLCNELETENRLAEAEKELLKSRELLNETEKLAGIGGWEWDVLSETMLWTEETYRIHDLEPGEIGPLSSCHIDRSLECYREKDRSLVLAAFRNCCENGLPYDLEVPFTSATGRSLWIRTAGRPVYDRNRVVKVVGHIMDITALKQAEQERELLQEKLNQSQKMESVGRLAGGVAHDFNNMLGVILGHAELLLQNVSEADKSRRSLEEIEKAARRSAGLVSQLLAFARKQTIAPRVLDLNDTVSGMLNMLQRLIGENIDLTWIPGTGLWPVSMDPSQVDQVLANLCVNARDAIKGVGQLTIETANREFNREFCQSHDAYLPGQFIMLAVSDDGCGMDTRTIANLFEPFFTTKEIGRGTGLGLATVYGIVSQNNGFIIVESEPGRGSTFRVFIPRYAGSPAVSGEKVSTVTAAKGSETILLVEDEPSILEIGRKMLEHLGYRVLAAETPGAALQVAREHAGEIQLLITDVVMPEMNGRDLARNLLSIHPRIRRLFMSGYTADVIAHHGVLDPGVHFMQKPFSLQELAMKVQAALAT